MPHIPVILLVDDDDFVRSFVREVLIARGFQVLTAMNGRQALEISREFEGQIDLLISDVLMPQMNGPQLCAMISQERPATRILLMTGLVSSDIPDGLKPNVLHKPFSPALLVERIFGMLSEAGENMGASDLTDNRRSPLPMAMNV